MRCLVLMLCLSCATVSAPTSERIVGPSEVQQILNVRGCHACHALDAVYGGAALHREAREGVRQVPTGQVAPTLGSMERLRARWLRRFLAAPFAVRPGVPVHMPAQALTPLDIETLVLGWGAQPEPASTPVASREQLEQGERVFLARGCLRCHSVGARPRADDGEEFNQLARALAPDLSHVRERLSVETLKAFLREPSALKPGTLMPPPCLSEPDVEALASWLSAGL